MNNVTNISTQKITDTLKENYMPYTMSVILSRAIPEIDGFKPSHRKLLYTMYKMGLLKGARRKSADVVGRTMELNPHGDGAIYETMVRLTRANETLLHPFVDSKGNFGKVYSRDMAYAASRYTEVKLAEICELIFRNIDRNPVTFVPNYNGLTTEPVLFPTVYPNILVTPNQGIAVGMASNICSFNLSEVCETTIAYIKNENCDLFKTLHAPDFSTGGELVYNRQQLENIYKNGTGSFKVRAKYRFDKKNNCIEVFEIPYTTTIEAIIDKIVQLVNSNKIKEINDVRDESDLNGLKLTIDVKRNIDIDKLMHRLYNLTPLSDSFSCNFNILCGTNPKTMGIKEILDEWLIFRTECITREICYDIDKKEKQLNLLTGLSKILLDIDKAIQIIRHTEEDKKVIPNLVDYFKITEEQAEYICEIRLRNLNKEYLLNKVNERDSLEKELVELKKYLDDDSLIKDRIVKELKEVNKKYGIERKTTIVHEDDVETFEEEHFIEDYNLTLFLTKEGYFKKIPLVSLRSASAQKLKDDDYIIQEIETTNKNEVIFFSDKQNVYKAKIYDLEDCKASVMGSYMQNVLDLEDGENIIYMVVTSDYSGDMVYGFENGKFAKVPLNAFETKVNRKKLIKAYSDASPLMFINHSATDYDIIINRDDDKIMFVSTELIPMKTTKNTVGVQVMNLKKGSILKSVRIASEEEVERYNKFRSTKIPMTGHFVSTIEQVSL